MLIGESAQVETVENIAANAREDPAVEQSRRPLTMHFGPHQILVNLDVKFRKGLSAEEVSGAVDRLEAKIRSAHPDRCRIFIEAERLVHGPGDAA